MFFAHLGGFGLLGLGILDSSFLFMPLGNDLLIVGLTARYPHRLPYYAVMAAAGSVLGCLLVDVVFRRLGDKGLHRIVSEKRLAGVRKKMEKGAGWTLAIAALMPPPFPFTAFVGAASALRYPRTKMLAVIGASRVVRFLAIGSLAIAFGRHILRVAKTPAFEYTMVGFIALCIVGSAFSLFRWFRPGKPA